MGIEYLNFCEAFTRDLKVQNNCCTMHTLNDDKQNYQIGSKKLSVESLNEPIKILKNYPMFLR